jgi:inosine-uridine nucleoside N-ribohydrolase
MPVSSVILKDPSITNRISVVAMGFDDRPAGGDEFNIKNDPLAWQIILDSQVPVVVGSSAVARRGLRLTPTEAAALIQPHGAVTWSNQSLPAGRFTSQRGSR